LCFAQVILSNKFNSTSVCVRALRTRAHGRTGQSGQFKTVKAADFKFDMHVPMESPDMTP